MALPQYRRLVGEMSRGPTVRDQSIEYGAEISTGGESGVPDTVVLVTSDGVYAGPIAGKEDESTLELSLGMDEIDELECNGFLRQTVTLAAGGDRYTIPSAGLDTIKFAKAIINNSHLDNECGRSGFGLLRFSLCKWATCLGAALFLVGLAFSITMIGIVIGVPFMVAGAGLLLGSYGYAKIGYRMGDNVWIRPSREANPA